jgi:hypothetical protein
MQYKHVDLSDSGYSKRKAARRNRPRWFYFLTHGPYP